MANPVKAANVYKTYRREDLKPEYRAEESPFPPEAIIADINGATLHHFYPGGGGISTVPQLQVAIHLLNKSAEDNPKYLKHSAILARFVGVDLERYQSAVQKVNMHWDPESVLGELEKEILDNTFRNTGF
jgi:hypothetical protein